MKIQNLLTALFCVSILAAGCSKEGCTDGNATNYDSSADTFDGSCQYEGQVVFWYDQETSGYLDYIYSTSLSFHIDGQIVGSTATSQYWTGAPDCGDDASITITKDLGNVTSLASTYEVIDNDGFVVWEGILNFEANTCLKVELTS